MRLHRSFARKASLLLLGLFVMAPGCRDQPDPSASRAAPAASPLVLAMPMWTPVGSMSTKRAYHTATLLLDGRVLVVGGQSDAQTYLDTAETYDWVTKTWSPVPMKLVTARSKHTATLLGNGHVLVVGGHSKSGSISTAEDFDPKTNQWSPAGTLMVAREDHAATLLNDNTVLITGGYDGLQAVTPSAELYRPPPANPTWTLFAGPKTARWKHTATLLPGDKVLVVAGYSAPGNPATFASDAELYVPMQGWQSIPLLTPRALHTATLLGDGTALIVGGETSNGMTTQQTNSVERYYATPMPLFQQDDNLPSARDWHTATLVGNAKALIVGGLPATASADLFDPTRPATMRWSMPQALNTGRYGHTATLLSNGHVLAAGGQSLQLPYYLDSAEVYQPSPLGAGCAGADECVSGFCENSVCCEPPCCALAEGTACDDKNPCTDSDTCKSGGCTGVQKSCSMPTTPCHDATCNPATGQCEMAAQPKPAGASCDDGDPCTALDQCDTLGACAGTAVACQAQDVCHDPGTCDAKTGQCDSPAKSPCNLDPLNPLPTVPDNVILCQSNSDCKSGESCIEGVCCDSPCAEFCHSCLVPGHVGKCTVEPKGLDLRHDCEVGTDCLNTCPEPGGSVCVGAGAGDQCSPIVCTDTAHGLTPATCEKYGPDCATGSRVPFSCSPYACFAPLGCRTSCSSVNDCAPSFVCDPTFHCVPPPPVENSRDLGGCTAAREKPGSARRALAALLAALGLAAARRRGRARPSLL